MVRWACLWGLRRQLRLMGIISGRLESPRETNLSRLLAEVLVGCPTWRKLVLSLLLNPISCGHYIVERSKYEPHFRAVSVNILPSKHSTNLQFREFLLQIHKQHRSRLVAYISIIVNGRYQWRFSSKTNLSG